jgi:hypothetical protein
MERETLQCLGSFRVWDTVQVHSSVTAVAMVLCAVACRPSFEMAAMESYTIAGSVCCANLKEGAKKSLKGTWKTE